MHRGQLLYAQPNRRRQAQNLEKNMPKQLTIYDEVEKDMSPQFLSYINELVKPVRIQKSPQKKQSERDILKAEDSEKEKHEEREKDKQSARSVESLILEKIPVNIAKVEGEESGMKSELKSSVRILQSLTESLRNRDRKNRNIDEIIRKKSSELSSNFDAEGNKSFLDGMDKYVEELQKHSKERSNQKQKQKDRQLMKEREQQRERQRQRQNSRSNEKARLEELSQILYENTVLKNRIQLYESRFEQIQCAVFTLIEQYIIDIVRHSQQQQKAYKKQIKELNRALKLAIDKVNIQQQQLLELRSFFSDFQSQLDLYNSERFNKHKHDIFLKKQKNYDLRTEQADFKHLRTEQYQPCELSQESRSNRIRDHYAIPTSGFHQARPKISSCMFPSKNSKVISSKNSKELITNHKYKSREKTRKNSENIDFDY